MADEASRLNYGVPVPAISFWRRWLGDEAVAIPTYPFPGSELDAGKHRKHIEDIQCLFPGECVEFLRVGGAV